MDRTDAAARATDNIAAAFTALSEYEANERYVRLEALGIVGKVMSCILMTVIVHRDMDVVAFWCRELLVCRQSIVGDCKRHPLHSRLSTTTLN